MTPEILKSLLVPMKVTLLARFQAEFMIRGGMCLSISNVAYGSLSSILAYSGHVRLSPRSRPKSEHRGTSAWCHHCRFGKLT